MVFLIYIRRTTYHMTKGQSITYTIFHVTIVNTFDGGSNKRESQIKKMKTID
uniref:Uncharacterized protein MANES_16G131700 n=1 Tax=Rhizophora mucronata TaxID=61149 RepID=A0A2P2LP39_RHIMU